MMMKSTLTKQMLLVATFLVLLPACFARPQSTIDSQDSSVSSEVVPNVADWRKFYSSYNGISHPQPSSMEENQSPLERIQLQLLAQLAQQNAIGAGGSGPWDPLYRLPEMKRQVRYRQCYFNPISCFKK